MFSKKIKELSFFLIPWIAIAILQFFLIPAKSYTRFEYLKDLLGHPLNSMPLAYIAICSFLLCVAVVILFAFLNIFIKRYIPLPRIVFYLLATIFALITAYFIFFFLSGQFGILEPYKYISLVESPATSWQRNLPRNLLFLFQLAIPAALPIWSIEAILARAPKIRNKKLLFSSLCGTLLLLIGLSAPFTFLLMAIPLGLYKFDYFGLLTADLAGGIFSAVAILGGAILLFTLVFQIHHSKTKG